jgi:hypothetical protein
MMHHHRLFELHELPADAAPEEIARALQARQFQLPAAVKAGELLFLNDSLTAQPDRFQEWAVARLERPLDPDAGRIPVRIIDSLTASGVRSMAESVRAYLGGRPTAWPAERRWVRLSSRQVNP